MAVYAVDGAETPASLARLANSALMKGEAGVLRPTDMQVTELPVPGGFVRVMPGAVAVKNTYQLNSNQIYLVDLTDELGAPTSEDVAVPATGSAGGAVRYVIQRVIDPQYPGVQVPADPDAFRYDPLEVVDDLTAVTDSFYALARIDQPASTATITNSMITDLRKVANPKSDDVLRVHPVAAAEAETLSFTGIEGEGFPNVGKEFIDIPSWATRAQIRAEWLGVRHAAGDSYGECWVNYGPWNGTQYELSTVRYSWDTVDVPNVDRRPWTVADDVYIPAEYRGTNQAFVMIARLDPAAASGLTSMDARSGVIMSVKFLEVAD